MAADLGLFSEHSSACELVYRRFVGDCCIRSLDLLRPSLYEPISVII